MAKSIPNDPRIALDDSLGAVRSYLDAIRLAAEGAFKRDSRTLCAFDLLIEKALAELTTAQDVADSLESAS